ncbi:ATP-dependent RNA helicase SUV3L, mitochondrial [Coccomyxa sp. Obi]|nr:ATP-dependent RNA helicase SUV3L, mitochondrial [Coccomyxa sp. Obi]
MVSVGALSGSIFRHIWLCQGHRSFTTVAALRAMEAIAPPPEAEEGFEAAQSAAHLTDLTCPASWYPAARMMRRRVVAHMGPTNSGKTHAALSELKAAETGVYCGPLRLLAWEVAEKLNADKIACNLVTGQERRTVPGARHAACTVEMASVTRAVDVAVVDEVQMLADGGRGHAFTRALLGLPARTLHLCGDAAVLPLLCQLVADAGDTLEVRTYERLLPLVPQAAALTSLKTVRRGDCLVAFSRREVHAIKRAIDSHGAFKSCIVYGALPAEARTAQATLFNAPRTGFNVLAASDAVGMGLNLNIRRVVFTSMEKFDGTTFRPLTPPEVKQIAGRAGRYGSRYASGQVTCLNEADMAFLHASLEAENPVLERACLFPRYQQLALFAEQHPDLNLADALENFADRATLSDHFFFSDYEAMHKLALMLRHLPLSLRDAYTFAISPADPDDPIIASALLSFATAYCQRGTVNVGLAQSVPVRPARNEAELAQLEAAYAVLDLYVWLSYRLEDSFPGRTIALQQRAAVASLVEEALPRILADPDAISRRQKTRERRALMETTRAMQEHFNGASWDRKLGLTLAPPTYDHVVPGAPVPVKRKKKKYSV